MTSIVVPFVVCLLLFPANLLQARPDFSGKWTKVPAAAGPPEATLTITQTADTLTLDTEGQRWIFKLDGSESKTVTKQGNPPREVVHITTSRWDGNTLVTSLQVRSNQDGNYTVRSAMSLAGGTLTVRATATSLTTGAVLSDDTSRYAK